jgi:hypothetical protein
VGDERSWSRLALSLPNGFKDLIYFSLFFVKMELMQEKLIDYVDGIKSITGPGLYPIGAILLKDNEEDEISNYLQKEGFQIFDEREFERRAGDIADALAKGEHLAFKISRNARPELDNFLTSFTHGQIWMEVPGERERRLINPVPDAAKIVLIMPADIFDESRLVRLISSVCRL